MNSTAARVLTLVAFVVMGFTFGIVGAFVQAHRFLISIGNVIVTIPWGTVLVLIALAIVTRAATLATDTRWGAWLFVTGWLTATVLMAAETSSGDLAISSGPRQLVYLFGGVILSVALATIPATFHFSQLRARGTNTQPDASV